MRFLYSSGRIFNEVYKDEAIPLRPGYPLPEQIKDIRVVQKDDDKEGEDREDIFVHMARIMEEYSDDFRYEMKFKRHQPAYDILSDSELRGYFGWRTAYREGEVLKAETYPEIYEFELINGIGTTGPEDTYKKLLKLSEDYPSYREQIRKNINDFVVFNDLPAGLYLETASYRCDEDMHIVFGMDDEKKARGDFLKTLLRLAGDDIKDSGLYENELLKDSEEAAHFLFKEMDLYYSSKRKKSLKEELFGRKEAWPYNIFSGSVVAVKCKDEGYEYKLSEERSFRFMRGHWTVERHSLQNGAPGLIAGFLYCLEGINSYIYSIPCTRANSLNTCTRHVSSIENQFQIVFLTNLNNLSQLANTTTIAYKDDSTGLIVDFLLNINRVKAEIVINISKCCMHVLIENSMIGRNESNRGRDYFITVLPTIAHF